ncbi:MAG: amidohydrolase family protein [Chloroflexi bacterium]|nr:amidohydrolase family protein [Chloroflexota bacterium]
MTSDRLYLQGARLVDGQGGSVPNGAVLVDGERIVAAGPSASVPRPADAQLIELDGCTLLPGFIDCHDHLGIDLGDEEAQSRESAAWQTVRVLRNGRRCLDAGITTVRDLGEKDHFDVEWRRVFATGQAEGPQLLIAGRIVTRTGGHAWFFGRQADGPDEVRRAVREQLRAGVDLIKVMLTGGAGTAGTDPTAAGYTRDEIVAAVEEAHAGGRKIAGHGYAGQAVRWAVEAGIDSIEHGAFLDATDLSLLAEHGTFLVVTYGVYAAGSEASHVPPAMAEQLRRVRGRYVETLARARELGVRIATGGDTHHADPGLEAEGLRQAGFSGSQTISALTSQAAQLCGLEDRGVLAPGKRADILAVEGDPLEDVSRVRAVRLVIQAGRQRRWVGGRDAAERQEVFV